MDAAFLNDHDREALRHSTLCSAMNEDELSSVMASGRILNLGRSEYLFEQGERAHNLFLILDGWAQITRDECDGTHTLIETFHRGDCLAEAPAFLGKIYPASAQAMTDLKVLTINGEMLLDIMQSNRALLAQALASVFRKLHTLIDDVESLKTLTIRERLANFLLEHARSTPDGQAFTLPFSKSLIAAKIGTSPQQLSRTFTELKEFGVTSRGQKTTIEESDVLRAMLSKT
ncbi:hypothetical protein ROLI_002190 [Roseobacter fucihabitans]|uniref:Crp/Fnr family transcriptional regulator n=1 Tax=Roseobacter fucihabitans TaxID=1537242 RepID=A0ABZ2BQH7_9RHOB|nr:Crp/Fnr family transcriptional regulator [Roseobacter litoralis]MBC6963470.1 cAMP-activated global transcriptional regulator CRP [Roseobacter litoralis]